MIYIKSHALDPIHREHVNAINRRLRMHAGDPAFAPGRMEAEDARLHYYNGSYTGYAMMARLLGLVDVEWLPG